MLGCSRILEPPAPFNLFLSPNRIVFPAEATAEEIFFLYLQHGEINR